MCFSIIQVTGKLTQLKGKRFGHSDVFGVLNLHASIADTAKKKNDNLVDTDSFLIPSTQSKTYRLKKHKDVSSKSFHGFIPTSNHRNVRSKRGGVHTLPKMIHTTGKHNDNENVEPLRETSPSVAKKETFDNNALHQGNQVNTAEGESKNKNSEIVPVGTGTNKDNKNADADRPGINNTEKTILNETDGAKKTEVTNGSTTAAAIGNGTTPKPEKCPNQTDSTELQIITKFRYYKTYCSLHRVDWSIAQQNGHSKIRDYTIAVICRYLAFGVVNEFTSNC